MVQLSSEVLEGHAAASVSGCVSLTKQMAGICTYKAQSVNIYVRVDFILMTVIPKDMMFMMDWCTIQVDLS